KPGYGDGMLCGRRLGWLERQMAALRDEPVIVAMHHPPFRTLIGHMDEMGLTEGAAELEALVRRHANVERLVCGHLHRAIDVRYGGAIAAVCPAPAHQVTLNLDPDAEANWMLGPPAFRVHAWDAASQ